MKRVLITLCVLSFAKTLLAAVPPATEDFLVGCFEKIYDVSPSGRLVKIPQGVQWIFNFSDESSRLSVSAEGVRGCSIPFVLKSPESLGNRIAFVQSNLSLDEDVNNTCYSMSEFISFIDLPWSGYLHADKQTMRISYVGYGNKRYVSDWTKIECPEIKPEP